MCFLMQKPTYFYLGARRQFNLIKYGITCTLMDRIFQY